MDIYEWLNKNILNRRFELSSNLYTPEDKEKLDDNSEVLFDLLKDISSLGTKIHNSCIKFYPMFTMADGRRTFSIEDITEENYELLKEIEFEKVPLILRALVADILWTQKKEFFASKIAADTYWDLFELWYSDEDNVGTLDMIRRALCIAIQTNYSSLYSKICAWFEKFLDEKFVNIDGFFSLRIMELFAEQKNYDVTNFLPVLDKFILKNINDLSKVEQAYELKTQCFYKLKKKEDATHTNILLADYYVSFAEKTMEADIQGSLRAVHILQKAIVLYRNNGQAQKAENTHRKLVEVQKEIPKIMVPVSVEFDIKEIVENIKCNLEGLSFEESIIRLTQMLVFDSRDSIKDRVIEEYRSSPLSHLFGKNLINAQGQTVLALPALDIHNPEENTKLLELHMHQNALEKQKIAGDIWFKNALILIRNKFTIDNSMLDFLIKDNPIIPEGRERIFRSGIGMFLRGDFFEAIHILAPQVENLFRNIAREVGGITVTLENDGSSMEKVLSSIFSLPELLDCYDNDIIFTFKGLLNEQAGANIRNEVAHGIIGEYACSTGVCLYFGVAVIKLLSYTSISCYEILRNNEKLKHYEMPSKDALKIIRKKNSPNP